MLKAFTAYTEEIDDVEAAVSEILRQLPKESLTTNSVGLLTCYADFVESGVVKALCDALPFHVVGSTTLGNSVPGATGTMLLTLMVLTGDGVYFAAGLTEPFFLAGKTQDDLKESFGNRNFGDTLGDEVQDNTPLGAEYRRVLAELGCRPSLMVSFAPLLVDVSGDFFVETFSAVSGGVPNFGMLSVDHNIDYHDSQIIFDGESYRDRYAFVLLAGEVHPRFFMGSISSEKIFREKGVVTASSGNQLQTINGKPVTEYLKEIGLTSDEEGTIIGINTFPFIVDYNDGTMPIVRAIFAQTPEGYAVCGGDIPVGAVLSVGSMNADEVVATTMESLSDALASQNIHCILIFSCVGRYFSLGYNPMREIDKTRDLLKGTGIPYQFTYSGGELCPVYERERHDDSVVNRNHNNTIVICVL
ncbi:MAG: FIST C-terminal domain-containing protein [Synergistaceae bacterium]|jgi:hypothetical protein|nr:FIST C-terminal domain-containing protein [Synergistaceae bacterium]